MYVNGVDRVGLTGFFSILVSSALSGACRLRRFELVVALSGVCRYLSGFSVRCLASLGAFLAGGGWIHGCSLGSLLLRGTFWSLRSSIGMALSGAVVGWLLVFVRIVRFLAGLSMVRLSQELSAGFARAYLGAWGRPSQGLLVSRRGFFCVCGYLGSRR